MPRRLPKSALTVCLSVLSISLILLTAASRGEPREPTATRPPVVAQAERGRATATSYVAPQRPTLGNEPQEERSRIWSNEPPLVRLARERFGAELTETDARFFAAVAENDWADLRPNADVTVNPEKPSSWATFPTLRADRIHWLCNDAAARKLIPSRGMWLRGVKIDGKVDLYRSEVPFSLTFYDCLFADGLNISHAKLQELDIRNCCSAPIAARAVHVTENLYLLTTCVFGGIDLIDAHIGGDFDFSGGSAFQGMGPHDVEQPGVAINLHDGKVDGDIKLGDGFHAIGQIRLIGVAIGQSLSCGGGKFNGCQQTAIDARRATIGGNVVCTTGFVAEGGLELRRAKIGSDLDCSGGRFIGVSDEALSADLAEIGGQVLFCDGYHAEGETRLINATVGGDVDGDNGHFLNPKGDALTLDGTVIGRSLRIGADPTSPTDETQNLPTGFLTRGTFRLWSTQVNQDILANGARFEAPTGTAILACNMKVASRVVLTAVSAVGTVNLFSTDIEHELDLRASTFDGRQAYGKIALWANAMKVRGHVYCNRVDDAEGPNRFVVYGAASFQFAKIDMHWDLCGAELINPEGDALDASDCRIGGYVNIDSVRIAGRASFSRAKVDGMWILNKSVEPEKSRLDLRFAHIWVIKDERLDDWPPAGQLQLEGLVYDHFDDDSPLDVHDRLEWLRRQYAPITVPVVRTTASVLPMQQIVASDNARERVAPRRFTTNGAGSVLQPTAQCDPAALETTDRYAVVPVEYEARAAAIAGPQQTGALETPGMPNPTTTLNEDASTGNPQTPPPVAEAVRPSSKATVEAPAPRPASSDDSSNEALPDAAPATIGATVSSPDPVGRRYITQPYTQLAAVYRAIGQDEQANTVLVARAERLGELSPRFSAQGLWYRYLGRLIGYGYEPFRAIKIGLVIIALGALVFTIGNRRNLMAETKLAEQVLESGSQLGLVSPTYPRFNALVYSLDVFLPFVDLNQVCYWIPGEKPTKPRKSRNCLMHVGKYSLKWSAVLHGYLWFQTLAGWTLCTLLAAAVTGIVQS